MVLDTGGGGHSKDHEDPDDNEDQSRLRVNTTFHAEGLRRPAGHASPRRFTLIELLVVIAIIAELQELSPADRWSIVPHPRSLQAVLFGGGGASVVALGAEGGNVAFLDGSTAWYRTDQMVQHFTCSESTGYLGLWPDRR